MTLPPLNLSMKKDLLSGSAGTFTTAFDIPFSFDHSGWNVAVRSSGDQSARGSSGQGSGAGAGTGIGGLLAGINPRVLLIAGVVYILMRKK